MKFSLSIYTFYIYFTNKGYFESNQKLPITPNLGTDYSSVLTEVNTKWLNIEN